MNFKKLIKKYIRKLGWDLHRLDITKDPIFQVMQVIKYKNIDMVLDVGANIGQFAESIRNMGYENKIISFEPLKNEHLILFNKSIKDKLWDVYERCAIGEHDNNTIINVSQNSVSSSILKILESHTEIVKESEIMNAELVPLKRLDSIAPKILNLNNNILLKIDAQGYEWQILEGSVNTLKNISVVLIELSLTKLYENQKLWRDIVDRMENNDFVLWTLLNGFTDQKTGRSLQLDAIFINKHLN
jgi:FkbM family methyltransferase